MSHAATDSALSIARSHGPIVATLPRFSDVPLSFGGFAFETGAPPKTAGIFILTRRIGAVLYPAFIGYAGNLAEAVEAANGSGLPGLDEVDGCYWTPRPQPRQRTHIARDLIGKYHPPLNIEHRKAPAAPEIVALVPDRFAGGEQHAAPAVPAGSVVASEDDLARLVDHFYAAARLDPVIGPVFARTVRDWDEHARTVRDFWSHAMLGTRRYSGTPFTPHLTMGLKPEHFERWIALFRTSAAATLAPEAAAFAVAKVEHMGQCFQTGLFLPALPAAERTG